MCCKTVDQILHGNSKVGDAPSMGVSEGSVESVQVSHDYTVHPKDLSRLAAQLRLPLRHCLRSRDDSIKIFF